MKTIFRTFLTTLLVASFCFHAHADDRRDKVKAVFLYKFFDYITWADNHDPAKNPPAVVCILGDAGFEQTLQYISDKKQAKLSNQKIHISSASEAKKCHILFVDQANRAAIQQSIPDHVLTISDANNFAQSGGMVELKDKADKIELVINLKAVKQSNLNVSSNLLKIATVIR